MGYRSNPILLRLGSTVNWSSTSFTKYDYSLHHLKHLQVYNYLNQLFRTAFFASRIFFFSHIDYLKYNSKNIINVHLFDQRYFWTKSIKFFWRISRGKLDTFKKARGLVYWKPWTRRIRFHNSIYLRRKKLVQIFFLFSKFILPHLKYDNKTNHIGRILNAVIRRNGLLQILSSIIRFNIRLLKKSWSFKKIIYSFKNYVLTILKLIKLISAILYFSKNAIEFTEFSRLARIQKAYNSVKLKLSSLDNVLNGGKIALDRKTSIRTLSYKSTPSVTILRKRELTSNYTYRLHRQSKKIYKKFRYRLRKHAKRSLFINKIKKAKKLRSVFKIQGRKTKKLNLKRRLNLRKRYLLRKYVNFRRRSLNIRRRKVRKYIDFRRRILRVRRKRVKRKLWFLYRKKFRSLGKIKKYLKKFFKQRARHRILIYSKKTHLNLQESLKPLKLYNLQKKSFKYKRRAPRRRLYRKYNYKKYTQIYTKRHTRRHFHFINSRRRKNRFKKLKKFLFIKRRRRWRIKRLQRPRILRLRHSFTIVRYVKTTPSQNIQFYRNIHSISTLYTRLLRRKKPLTQYTIKFNDKLRNFYKFKIAKRFLRKLSYYLLLKKSRKLSIIRRKVKKLLKISKRFLLNSKKSLKKKPKTSYLRLKNFLSISNVYNKKQIKILRGSFFRGITFSSPIEFHSAERPYTSKQSLFKDLYIYIAYFVFRQTNFLQVLLTKMLQPIYKFDIFLKNLFSFLRRVWYHQVLLIVKQDLLKIIGNRLIVNFARIQRGCYHPDLLTRFIVFRLLYQYRFGEIIYPLLKELSKLRKRNKISGAMVICSGRLTRKQRASRRSMVLRKIGLNTLSSKILYSFNTVRLRYGMSGIKLFVYYNN